VAERTETTRTIRIILYDRGWTIRQLAREIGYGYQHTTRLMRGERPIPLRFLVACERALDLPPGFLRNERACA